MDYLFTRRYSMAHRLYAMGGKCAVPHGHNEFVRVRCRPESEITVPQNMALDFETAKSCWHEWIDTAVDHAFQLSDQDPLIGYFKKEEPTRVHRLLVTPGDPTTEMLALCMARKFKALCGAILVLQELEIEETPTNSVILRLAYPTGTVSRFQSIWLAAPTNPKKWWDRPDMSINDLGAA